MREKGAPVSDLTLIASLNSQTVFLTLPTHPSTQFPSEFNTLSLQSCFCEAVEALQLRSRLTNWTNWKLNSIKKMHQFRKIKSGNFNFFQNASADDSPHRDL